MGIIDSWIPRIAKKDFSETINWIDALVVLTLGILLAGFIYLDMTPVDVSIPVKIVDKHHIIVDQEYTDVIPPVREQVLKCEDHIVSFKITHKTYSPPHHVILYTTQVLPFSKKDKVRLIIFRKTILDMLLKTKSLEA